MKIPGFTAEASGYPAGMYYQADGSSGSSGAEGIIMALNLDPCRGCAHLAGCAKARCYCICYGGDWSPGHFGSQFPCGIRF